MSELPKLPAPPMPWPDLPPLPVVKMPPHIAPPRNSLRAAAPQNTSQLAAAIVSVVIALGGGAGIASMFKGNDGMTRTQADTIIASQATVGKDVTSIKEYLKAAAAVEAKRTQIDTAVLCKLNGGAFARQVKCDTIDDWDPMPLGVTTGPFKAQRDYPELPQPPQ